METGIRAIIGQGRTVTVSNRITGQPVQKLGTRFAGLQPIGLTHIFPSPESLASADLSGLGLSRTETETIRAFVRVVIDDSIP